MSQIYWRMSNGYLIKITDMTMEHLSNAINKFYKRKKYKEEVKAMALELEYRLQIQARTPRGNNG